MTQPVSLSRQDHIAIVTLDRGDGRNALSLDLMARLIALAGDINADPEIRAVVVTGQGGFCAGADLKDQGLAARRKLPLVARRRSLKIGADLCRAWAGIEAPTVAAIEGFCIGGGVVLATACDFRIAGRGAHFRLPEVPLGMNMSWQSVPRLVALMGPARTKRFTLLGEALPAPEAERWGLADEVVDDGAALAAATALARKLAALPPVAVQMAKEGIDAAAGALFAATSIMDRDQFALSQTGDDQAEAIQAFLEKRPARFTGN